MLARKFCVFCIGSVVSVSGVLSLTSCNEAGAAVQQEFTLEVVNNSSDRVRVQIAMMGSYLLRGAVDALRTSVGPDPDPYVLELDVDERVSVTVIRSIPAGAKDSAEDGVYVRELSAVYFFAEEAVFAYRGYAYLGFGCGVELAACEDSDDDSLVFHRSAGGALERLFVESPDRPFYLERDEQNRDLARLVITFVPAQPPLPEIA